jgi:uncharacterized protein (TIGR02217 family)
VPVVQNVLYPPNLPGLAFNVVRRPKGSTDVQPHVSGREVRLGYWTYPLYEWDLTYSVLRDFKPCPNYPILSELKLLEGFYLNKQGSLIPFFFSDPDDNFVAGQGLGIGDDVTRSFLLVRTWGDPSYVTTGGGLPAAIVTEPIGTVDTVGAKFYLNGLQQTLGVDYSFTGGGAAVTYVTFTTAPPSGVVVSADYLYGFYVRFKDDSLDFEKFSGAPGAGFWMVKKLTLVSLRGNLIPPPP